MLLAPSVGHDRARTQDRRRECQDDAELTELDGRLVPFVGAGASRLAKCPSWEEFATGFLKQLVGHRVLNFSQVEQILNQHLSPRIILSLARAIAEQNGISPDYEDIIHRGRDVTDSDGRRLYGALARLGNVFVTTNYDYWLDRVLDPSPLDLGAPDSQNTPETDVIQRNVIYKVEDFSPHQLNTENSVIHLHGSLRDPNTMVMTTAQAENELLYRFEFPERSGALLHFLGQMGERWNISLFHYRNHGAAYGRVLMGIQVPVEERPEFQKFLDNLGLQYWDESGNAAYEMFLG